MALTPRHSLWWLARGGQQECRDTSFFLLLFFSLLLCSSSFFLLLFLCLLLCSSSFSFSFPLSFLHSASFSDLPYSSFQFFVIFFSLLRAIMIITCTAACMLIITTILSLLCVQDLIIVSLHRHLFFLLLFLCSPLFIFPCIFFLSRPSKKNEHKKENCRHVLFPCLWE